MPFFDNKLAVLTLILCIPLLFLPKINLLTVGGESAGIRYDDLILLIVGSLILCAHLFSRKDIYKIEVWILLITAFSFVSFFANRILMNFDIIYMDAKIFYVVRLLEYFMFFYIGATATRFVKGEIVVQIFLVWNLLLMTLQKLGWIGAITVLGYDSDVASRVQGIASFPSEMGLLLNLIFCYLVFDKNHSRWISIFPSKVFQHFLNRSYIYWMFALFSVFVIFTGNRVSIVALVFCFLARLKQQYRFRSLGSLVSLFIIVPVLFLGMGGLVMKTRAIYERSSGLLSVKNLNLAEAIWDRIDLRKDPVGNEVVNSRDYDTSWWMRIHKWVHATKAYFFNPVVYLQGLGPGFAWAALDGGLLRIFLENGIIGCILYWKFFSSIYKINPQTKWMTIALLLNMVFFDAYLAYKTMSFFLFASGYAFESEKRKYSFLSKDEPIIIPLKASQPLQLIFD